jgi:hypothetical protein
MSIVLLGSTSGSCTLQEQAVAGTSVITLPVGTGTAVVNGVNGTIVQDTVVTASGTAVNFTGIPSWAKRVTVMFSGVSTNGTSGILMQIGSGSVQTSGYLGSGSGSSSSVGSTSYTTGVGIRSLVATYLVHGKAEFANITGNSWVCSSLVANSANAETFYSGGSVTLSGVLDRVRITTVNGTDAFDAGSINILYE